MNYIDNYSINKKEIKVRPNMLPVLAPKGGEEELNALFMIDMRKLVDC